MTPERRFGGVGRFAAARSCRLLHSVVILFALSLVSCGDVSPETGSPEAATVTPDALHERLQSSEEPPLLVDVRTPGEFAAFHIEGARLAPFPTVVDDLRDVPKDREIVLVCVVGSRSGKAQERLSGRGYTNLRNLEGGMRAWTQRGYPVTTTN